MLTIKNCKNSLVLNESIILYQATSITFLNFVWLRLDITTKCLGDCLCVYSTEQPDQEVFLQSPGVTELPHSLSSGSFWHFPLV